MYNLEILEPLKIKISPQFEYEIAKSTSDNLIDILSPFCDKLNVAGSIRRQKPFVKDIEIVCLPKKVFFQTELFGNGINMIIPEFRKAIDAVSDRIIRGSLDGRYIQILLKTGIALDLFLPQPHDYYRHYAIRTGSSDYSREFIARSWKKKGWCGTNAGLRKIEDCYQSGSTWKCFKPNPELPPEWQSEQEFFDWLDVKWINPSERNV